MMGVEPLITLGVIVVGVSAYKPGNGIVESNAVPAGVGKNNLLLRLLCWGFKVG